MTTPSNTNDPTHLREPIEDRLDETTRDALDTLESLADGDWDDNGLGAVLSLAFEEICRLAALRPDPTVVAELTDEDDNYLGTLDTMADVPGDWDRESHGDKHAENAALFRQLLHLPGSVPAKAQCYGCRKAATTTIDIDFRSIHPSIEAVKESGRRVCDHCLNWQKNVYGDNAITVIEGDQA